MASWAGRGQRPSGERGSGRLKNEWAAVGPAGLEKKKKRKSIKN